MRACVRAYVIVCTDTQNRCVDAVSTQSRARRCRHRHELKIHWGEEHDYFFLSLSLSLSFSLSPSLYKRTHATLPIPWHWSELPHTITSPNFWDYWLAGLSKDLGARQIRTLVRMVRWQSVKVVAFRNKLLADLVVFSRHLLFLTVSKVHQFVPLLIVETWAYAD